MDGGPVIEKYEGVVITVAVTEIKSGHEVIRVQLVVKDAVPFNTVFSTGIHLNMDYLMLHECFVYSNVFVLFAPCTSLHNFPVDTGLITKEDPLTPLQGILNLTLNIEKLSRLDQLVVVAELFKLLQHFIPHMPSSQLNTQ